MFFRFIGRMYFYLVIVPYVSRLLKLIIEDAILKHGSEYLSPATREALQRQQNRRNRKSYTQS